MKKGLHLLLAALLVTAATVPIGGEERRTVFDEPLPYRRFLTKSTASSAHLFIFRKERKNRSIRA